MALTPGTRVGPYEVLSAIGAGGMGEVYRARDTKLNRDVALKVLPDLFAKDSERLARFQREAQVLASLNHPNIAHIHGLEERPDNADSGGVRALVLELVEGPTLAERIATGPIPLAEALLIVRQIADALEAAHDQGIIHRDLKPANIKVRDDGTVKVLDFGLAKALAADSGSGTSDPTLSPTMTARHTEMGMILGTAAYMSPEQAKGKSADRRADIWAFGVVFFEMLTGAQVFTGETTSEVMASVMKEDPDWRRLPSTLPPAIVRLLHRCLEKDPRKRLSAIGDARFDLDDTTVAEVRASQPSAPTGWPLARVAVAGVVCLIAGAGVMWAVASTWRPIAVTSVIRSSLLPPDNKMLFLDSEGVAISPDGRMVAFTTSDPQGNKSELWLRSVDALAAHAVEGGADAIQPFWSPDSQQIGFFTKDKLKRVPAAGGRVEDVCDASDARGGSWSTQNVILFAPSSAAPLMRVAASGGTPQAATTLDSSRSETGQRFPLFLPDGDHFLYASMPARGSTFDVYVGSLAGGKPELLMQAESRPAFAPQGYLVFERRGGLMAQRFDPAKRALIGDPFSLQDTPGAVGVTWLAGSAISLSSTGAMAYLAAPPTNTNLVWFDTTGRQLSKIEVPPGLYEQIAVSPNGRQAVAERRSSPTVTDLWMIDLDRDGASKFSTLPGSNFFAAWSPDGKSITYSASPEGPEQIMIKPSNGSGPDVLGYKSATTFKQPQSWSPDGRYIVYTDLSPTTNSDMWLLPVAADGSPGKPVPYLQSPANEGSGAISPDGKWMAYLSDETGRYEVYVQSFPTPGHKFRVTTNGALAVWWSRDGRQLEISNSDMTELAFADVLPGAEFATSPPRVIGHLPKGLRAFDLTPDRQRLVALMIEGGNINMSVTLVQNWMAALQK